MDARHGAGCMSEHRLPEAQRRQGVKSPGGKLERAQRRAGRWLWVSCFLVQRDDGSWVKKTAAGTYRA